jgi:hypothetical protein
MEQPTAQQLAAKLAPLQKHREVFLRSGVLHGLECRIKKTLASQDAPCVDARIDGKQIVFRDGGARFDTFGAAVSATGPSVGDPAAVVTKLVELQLDGEWMTLEDFNKLIDQCRWGGGGRSSGRSSGAL